MRMPSLHFLPTLRFLTACGAALVICGISAANAAPPKKPAKGKKPAAPALPPPDMDRSSSRFILPENQAAYLEKMRAQISMTKRISDPFGRSQDPDASPPPQPPNSNDKEGPIGPRTKVTLEQSLANLKITTIIPAEKRFLANGLSYQEGEEITGKSRGKIVQIQIMSVKSSEIVFRNAETGEIATKKMKMLPPGMQPGTTLSEAPGLFRSQKDAPLNLDVPGQP